MWIMLKSVVQIFNSILNNSHHCAFLFLWATFNLCVPVCLSVDLCVTHNHDTFKSCVLCNIYVLVYIISVVATNLNWEQLYLQ